MDGLFDEWSLYSRILLHDYMRHQAISRLLRAFLAACGGPLRVVDLGCGDGWMAYECLKNSPVSLYVGIDTSSDALARLQTRPPIGGLPVGASRDLRCVDVRLAVGQFPKDVFNVVLASYCVHHFSQAEKTALLGDICRILEPGGMFFWVDEVRRPGQTRDEYCQALEQDMRLNWTALSRQEIEETLDHLRRFDFPEEESWMVQAANSAGFAAPTTLFRDDLFGCLAFVKED